ncbi:MAG: hypothetical protein HY660_02155 [Armatimonadetes bacterium]|nr:hypothetical protein [Armatimonadota bacterium]
MPSMHHRQYAVILPELDARGRYLAAKILAEMRGMGWAEARDLVSWRPCLVPCGSDGAAAEALRAALADAGIAATVSEVEEQVLRQQLLLMAGISMPKPPTTSTRGRRVLWWLAVSTVLPVLVSVAVSRLTSYDASRSSRQAPAGAMALDVQMGQEAITVQNRGATAWRECSASINDYYVQKFPELPANGTVSLALEEFADRGGIRYTLLRVPILFFSVQCSSPPGTWQKTS